MNSARIDPTLNNVPEGFRLFQEELRKEKGFSQANPDIRGRTIIKRHCGLRMLKVRCADDGVSAIFEFHVCEACGQSKLRYSWEGMG